MTSNDDSPVLSAQGRRMLKSTVPLMEVFVYGITASKTRYNSVVIFKAVPLKLEHCSKESGEVKCCKVCWFGFFCCFDRGLPFLLGKGKDIG